MSELFCVSFQSIHLFGRKEKLLFQKLHNKYKTKSKGPFLSPILNFIYFILPFVKLKSCSTKGLYAKINLSELFCVSFQSIHLSGRKGKYLCQRLVQKYKNKLNLPFFSPPYFESLKAQINKIIQTTMPIINCIKLNFCNNAGRTTVAIKSKIKLYKKSPNLFFCFFVISIILNITTLYIKSI